MIIFTNSRTLLNAAGFTSDARYLVLLCVVVLWLGALAVSIRSVMMDRLVRHAGIAGD